jgi:hypothetical protein
VRGEEIKETRVCSETKKERRGIYKRTRGQEGKRRRGEEEKRGSYPTQVASGRGSGADSS